MIRLELVKLPHIETLTLSTLNFKWQSYNPLFIYFMQHKYVSTNTWSTIQVRSSLVLLNFNDQTRTGQVTTHRDTYSQHINFTWQSYNPLFIYLFYATQICIHQYLVNNSSTTHRDTFSQHIKLHMAKLSSFIYLIYLFIWGFTSLSTLYRSYHNG